MTNATLDRLTGTMSAPTTQPIVVGTRVHTNLYDCGYGAVFAIHGEQAPASVPTRSRPPEPTKPYAGKTLRLRSRA